MNDDLIRYDRTTEANREAEMEQRTWLETHGDDDARDTAAYESRAAEMEERVKALGETRFHPNGDFEVLSPRNRTAQVLASLSTEERKALRESWGENHGGDEREENPGSTCGPGCGFCGRCS